MSPSRLRKRIARALMVSWREQPTRYDIEALQANVRRVGLVIRLRWALLVVLIIYSVFGGLAYASRMAPGELESRMFIPALALVFVVLYNAFYSLTYKRLGNIAPLNHLQLAFDAIVVTVLIYYSGGVNSWFWSMYSLFILEAAFILPKRRDAWLLMVGCVVLLGALEWLEFAGIVPHVDIPFASAALHRDAVFVAVRYGWQVAVLAGTAAVSTRLVGSQRAESAQRQALMVLDETTGLYSRAYFLRSLASEVIRAERDGRKLYVLLVDVDRFGEYNRRFGIEVGDQLLHKIAAVISRIVGQPSDLLATQNLAARFGGEEFVVLLAEEAQGGGAGLVEDAVRLGEMLCERIRKESVNGASVTVSIGLASYPADGRTPDELLDAADAALSAAVEAGGDRVMQAASTTAESDASELGDRYAGSLET